MVLYISYVAIVMMTYLLSRTIETVESPVSFLRFKRYYIPIALVMLLVPVLNILAAIVWGVCYFVAFIMGVGDGIVTIKESFKNGFWNKEI